MRPVRRDAISAGKLRGWAENRTLIIIELWGKKTEIYLVGESCIRSWISVNEGAPMRS